MRYTLRGGRQVESALLEENPRLFVDLAIRAVAKVSPDDIVAVIADLDPRAAILCDVVLRMAAAGDGVTAPASPIKAPSPSPAAKRDPRQPPVPGDVVLTTVQAGKLIGKDANAVSIAAARGGILGYKNDVGHWRVWKSAVEAYRPQRGKRRS